MFAGDTSHADLLATGVVPPRGNHAFARYVDMWALVRGSEGEPCHKFTMVLMKTSRQDSGTLKRPRQRGADQASLGL